VQTPTDSEIGSNPDLKLVVITNREVGLKGRHKDFSFDMSAYQADLENEVVSIPSEDGSTTVYVNAGKTQKRGFEFAGNYSPVKPLTLGVSYTRNHHKYVEFDEPVKSGGTYKSVDRSGKTPTFSPTYQQSVYLNFKSASGIKFRIQSDTWGEYYLDTANTKTYNGYQNIVKAMVGFEYESLDVVLNVENVTDKRYAVEVKDSYGSNSYSPAPPRNFLLTANYKF